MVGSYSGLRQGAQGAALISGVAGASVVEVGRAKVPWRARLAPKSKADRQGKKKVGAQVKWGGGTCTHRSRHPSNHFIAHARQLSSNFSITFSLRLEPSEHGVNPSASSLARPGMEASYILQHQFQANPLGRETGRGAPSRLRCFTLLPRPPWPGSQGSLSNCW